MHITPPRNAALLVAFLCLACITARAQPSKMYFGPRPDRVIDQAKVTYFVSPTGNDTHDGRTRATAFATIQKAADLVQPGETVLVTKGVYHQGMHIKTEGRPDAWISFIAEPGAEIRGSEVWKNWQPVPGQTGVYSAPRPTLFSNYQQPDTDLKQRTEQVFVNGTLLRQVSDPAMLKPKGTFYVNDASKQLLVCLQDGKNPNTETSEVTTLTYAIAIGGPPNMNWWRDEQTGLQNKAAYIRIDGFTIRHIANFSRMAAVQVRGIVHHVIIENCDIQWANYAGIANDSNIISVPEEKRWLRHIAQYIIVRHNITSNCGAQGIGGGDVSDALFEYNIVDNNNYKGISPWDEGGGIKTGFGGSRIVIRWNVVRNNLNHGLWFDYGATDCVIENNFIYNSLAGGILDEVTPRPDEVYPASGEEIYHTPTAAEVKAQKLTGTIIRNNIIVGTRAPGGDGIELSNACESEVYNNITYKNTGAGILFGGTPTRPDTRGLQRNHVFSNISFQDFIAATGQQDADDQGGRFFDNLAWNNLYLQTKSDHPFRISDLPAGAAEWKALNKGRENIVSAQSIFRNPEHFDFTLTDPQLAKKVGFQPTAMRLDWSEFYLPEAAAEVQHATMDYAPVNLSAVYNRALVDDVAGDGKGGWTDQGGNDMSLLPLGEQTLDGVKYLLGTKAQGAVLLANTQVKGETFPETVTIPLGRTADELRFLYTSAYTSPGEVARFIIRYADGTTEEAPVINEQQILDWWMDPIWQQYAVLNDHGVYVAWQGPNRQVGKVTLYHYWWKNPNPTKQIASIAVTDQFAQTKSCFFLLGITVAQHQQVGVNPRVFYLNFDGDIDAKSSANDDIEAQGYNQAAFDAGKFVKGVKGKAFVPSLPVYYAMPADFPVTGQGTISLWLKADDWHTAERVNMYKNADYTRVMTPFDTQQAYYRVSFEVKKEDMQTLMLRADIPGCGLNADVTALVKPGEWFNILLRWQPTSDGKGTRSAGFINGKLVDTNTRDGKPNNSGPRIYIGVPDNGGQAWRGAMDECAIWNYALSDAEIAALMADVKK